MSENPATHEELTQRELQQVHGDNFSTVYSNWVQAGRTSWDIALLFGQVRETSPGVSAVVHLVSVVMTPQMAKALMGTLGFTVKAYERDNGEIVMPDSIKRRTSPSASVSPSSSASPSTSPSASGSPENDEDES
jgi:hypothetical protein